MIVVGDSIGHGLLGEIGVKCEDARQQRDKRGVEKFLFPEERQLIKIITCQCCRVTNDYGSQYSCLSNAFE
uniref:Uncharacterized protein n=1 Tax=Vespula pensylvanica TaxID=30213 RepID=A0A834NS18_VESPE|nr:hypothetical protein H0235_011485 [Vespula pensylvanica]